MDINTLKDLLFATSILIVFASVSLFVGNIDAFVRKFGKENWSPYTFVFQLTISLALALLGAIGVEVFS